MTLAGVVGEAEGRAAVEPAEAVAAVEGEQAAPPGAPTHAQLEASALRRQRIASTPVPQRQQPVRPELRRPLAADRDVSDITRYGSSLSRSRRVVSCIPGPHTRELARHVGACPSDASGTASNTGHRACSQVITVDRLPQFLRKRKWPAMEAHGNTILTKLSLEEPHLNRQPRTTW